MDQARGMTMDGGFPLRIQRTTPVPTHTSSTRTLALQR